MWEVDRGDISKDIFGAHNTSVSDYQLLTSNLEVPSRHTLYAVSYTSMTCNVPNMLNHSFRVTRDLSDDAVVFLRRIQKAHVIEARIERQMMYFEPVDGVSCS
ncbi:hypothetical protein VNO80_19564 [Phaseolus coccineus]|uniref:Uncharacterized protein n=1 Tax=Phaseolus coccineus TaxID=3886 RepID=A0AAN9MGD1_PHACN